MKVCIMLLLTAAIISLAHAETTTGGSPVPMNTKPMVVTSHPGAECVTFFWPDTPDYYVGYRVLEGNPETTPQPLAGIEDMPSCDWGAFPSIERKPLAQGQADPFGIGWLAAHTEANKEDAVQFAFQAFADGTAYCSGLDNKGEQKREVFFEPVEDGVRMWMRVTSTVDVPGGFAVQQCLRYSGKTNREWRRPIALIPFLSEYDVQAYDSPNRSLSWVIRDGQWRNFPVQSQQYHTGPGAPMLTTNRRSDGAVDHGLILREALPEQLRPKGERPAPGQYASGMYWERTAYVSNRHPADCLHSSVDFGPLKADESRTVHGKFYFLRGRKDDLLSHWRRDFAATNK